MTRNEDTDLDEQFEKVKEGIGPDDKSSYAPAETPDDATERAEGSGVRSVRIAIVPEVG